MADRSKILLIAGCGKTEYLKESDGYQKVYLLILFQTLILCLCSQEVFAENTQKHLKISGISDKIKMYGCLSKGASFDNCLPGLSKNTLLKCDRKASLCNNNMTFFKDSIIWVSVYATLRFLFFIFAISYDSLLTIATDIFYWVALFLHLQREHSLSKCGICIPPRPWLQSTVALLLIPAFQCILYGFPKVSLRELLALLLAALAEEMAFRVLLPKLLSEQMHVSVISSTLFSSIIFALFHGTTRFAAASLPIVLLQILYAFCAGCAFCALVQKTKSVLPSVALHALINWTAENQTAGMALCVSTLAFSGLLAGYATIVFHKTQRGAVYL